TVHRNAADRMAAKLPQPAGHVKAEPAANSRRLTAPHESFRSRAGWNPSPGRPAPADPAGRRVLGESNEARYPVLAQDICGDEPPGSGRYRIRVPGSAPRVRLLPRAAGRRARD